MKKIIFMLLVASLALQCTTDTSLEEHDLNQDLVYNQQLDLTKQTPKLQFNTIDKGIYVGTAVSKDLTFHEKIFINIENDGRINAQIISNNLVSNSALKGKKITNKKNDYFFKGDIGQFNLTINNDEALITNATFLNKEAVVNVVKSKSTSKKMPSLGTFSNADQSFSGTWDITWEQNIDNYTANSITIVREGGATFILPALGNYSRTCILQDDVYDTTFDLNVSGSIQLLNTLLNYNLVGTDIENSGLTCSSQPMNLNISSDEWDWNGEFGNVFLDLFSLPIFID